jgi:hypothetical protein
MAWKRGTQNNSAGEIRKGNVNFSFQTILILDFFQIKVILENSLHRRLKPMESLVN